MPDADSPPPSAPTIVSSGKLRSESAQWFQSSLASVSYATNTSISYNKPLINVNAPGKEVAEMHKLAVIRVFHVHNTPPVPAPADRSSVNDHIVLRSDNGKWDNVLSSQKSNKYFPDETARILG